MELQISTAGEVKPIDFSPKTEIDEIVQNVLCILRTTKFTVPLDREFGIDVGIIDAPLSPRFRARVYSDILDNIRKYEPRVSLREIDITSNAEGKAEVVATIRIKEGSR